MDLQTLPVPGLSLLLKVQIHSSPSQLHRSKQFLVLLSLSPYRWFPVVFLLFCWKREHRLPFFSQLNHLCIIVWTALSGERRLNALSGLQRLQDKYCQILLQIPADGPRGRSDKCLVCVKCFDGFKLLCGWNERGQLWHENSCCPAKRQSGRTQSQSPHSTTDVNMKAEEWNGSFILIISIFNHLLIPL